jgi:hypothetical protein
MPPGPSVHIHFIAVAEAMWNYGPRGRNLDRHAQPGNGGRRESDEMPEDDMSCHSLNTRRKL